MFSSLFAGMYIIGASSKKKSAIKPVSNVVTLLSSISKSKAGKKHTEESKKKISKSVSGEKHPFYGKPLTEEHKNKIKETKRKNPQYFSEECRQKMSIAKKKYWENKKLEGHGES